MFSKIAILVAIVSVVNAGGAPIQYGAQVATAGFAHAPVAYSHAPALAYNHGPVAAYNAAPALAYNAAPALAYNAAPALAYSHAPAVAYGSVGAQAEHTVRGFGGLSTVSQYSKAVDSPFSSVRKTDTRVTNDALHAYATPIAHSYAAAPAYAAHGYAHAAPAYAQYAAAPYAAAPYAAAPYAAAPYAHAAPIAHHAYAGLAPAKSLTYSPVSPAVATLSYSTPYFNYGY